MIEQLILGSLVHNPDFRVKVMPHLKPELLETECFKTVFKLFQAFTEQYKHEPTKDAILIELDNLKSISEDTFTESQDAIEKIYSDKTSAMILKQDLEWCLNKTEKYLKDRACFLAIMQSMLIIDGKDKTLSRDSIPDILKNAIAISFDSNIGHDYIDDADARFDFYHRKEDLIPFSLTMLNKITGGGMRRKALVVPIAPTGVGKSMFLTNEAGFQLMRGKNVLYVTLEMAEERISERIDAKLLDVQIQDLKLLPKSTFRSKLDQIKSNPIGKVIVKEYAPGTFNANHLRYLLNELKNKKNFKPDIIMVDYLNLMASYRMKDPGNSYSYIKAVAEELRGVGMEFDVTIISPTQTNRQGMNAADYDLTEISESAGIAMTADLIFGFISTPELEQLNQMRVKQLKNRWGDLNAPTSFIIGVTRSKMQMFDIDMGTPTNAQPTNQSDSFNQKINTGNKPMLSGLKT